MELFGIIVIQNHHLPIQQHHQLLLYITIPSSISSHAISIATSSIRVGLLSLISIQSVVIILILSFAIGFLFISRLRKKTVPCDIEEQALVMKVELASEEEVQQQKEKETPIAEAGCPPPTNTQLDHKLRLDKISSRDNE